MDNKKSISLVDLAKGFDDFLTEAERKLIEAIEKGDGMLKLDPPPDEP